MLWEVRAATESNWLYESNSWSENNFTGNIKESGDQIETGMGRSNSPLLSFALKTLKTETSKPFKLAFFATFQLLHYYIPSHIIRKPEV